jgi:hypothetical protein
VSTSPQTELPNSWLLDPAGNLVLFLSNEIVVAGLSKNAIALAEASPWLFRAAIKGLPPGSKSSLLALTRLMNRAQSDSAFAAEEAKNGFRTICAHSAVAIWAAIETAIEQTLLNHIRQVPDSKAMMAAIAPSLKVDKLQTSSEADVRKLLRRWEGALDESDSARRAIQMLAAMKLQLALPEETRRCLTEMGEVRNALLHRGGVVDDWFVSKCHWLGLKPGDALIVDEAKLEAFIDAAHKFSVALIGACAASPFAYTVPGTDSTT